MYRPNNGKRFLRISCCNCSAPPLLKWFTSTTSSKRNCEEKRLKRKRNLEIIEKKKIRSFLFLTCLLDQTERLKSSKLDRTTAERERCAICEDAWPAPGTWGSRLVSLTTKPLPSRIASRTTLDMKRSKFVNLTDRGRLDVVCR